MVFSLAPTLVVVGAGLGAFSGFLVVAGLIGDQGGGFVGTLPGAFIGAILGSIAQTFKRQAW